MIKETPFSKLPRTPRNKLIEAERQGFDDGYFINPFKNFSGDSSIESAYRTAFIEGGAQRRMADRFEKSIEPKKVRSKR